MHAVGETTLTSRRGHTGRATPGSPSLPEATEEAGEVWTVGHATSGNWRMTTVRSADGRCSVLGESGHEGVEVALAPGKSWTAPGSTGQYTPVPRSHGPHHGL